MKITPKSVAVIASLALLCAAVSIWRTIESSDITKANPTPFIIAGRGLAEETAHAVHDRGRVVAVINAEHQQPADPLYSEWEAFRNELQKHNAITLEAAEVVAPDPNDMEPGVGCPMAAFKDILDRHGRADAIVFFMGLPAWHWFEEKKSVPQPVNAQIIVLDTLVASPQWHYEPYLKDKIITELIIGMGGSTGQVANPKTPREWFDKEYQIFTPQNYEALPHPPTP